MSGGAYDYGYSSLWRYSGDLEDETLENIIQDFSKLLRDLEWWKSGDIRKEDYLNSAAKFKEKWLKS